MASGIFPSPRSARPKSGTTGKAGGLIWEPLKGAISQRLKARNYPHLPLLQRIERNPSPANHNAPLNRTLHQRHR
jgi:hypothetical protein